MSVYVVSNKYCKVVTFYMYLIFILNYKDIRSNITWRNDTRIFLNLRKDNYKVIF